MKVSKKLTLGASALLAVMAAVFAFVGVSNEPERVGVLRAKVSIPMGQLLNKSDFEEVPISADLAGLYAQNLLPGAIALRSVFVGEILPRGSVSSAPDLNRVKITITPQQLPVSNLQAAESVELWSVSVDNQTASSRPTVSLLSPDAVILQKSADSSGFGISSNTIDVLINRIDLPQVLEAIAAASTEIVLVRNPSV
jgi:hypothetical protein